MTFYRKKIIDDYLSLGLLNNECIKNNFLYSFINIKSTPDFLKHIILISRNKPFLFISEMEKKLKFIIEPFVKFKCSISIESMSHQLDVIHVNLINNLVKSFVIPDEISGFILTKIIKKYKDKDCINEREYKYVNLNEVFINNIYKYNEKAKIFMNKDIINNKNSINKMEDKPILINNSVNTNSEENKINIKNNNLINSNGLEKEEKTILENESENKNDDNKSNISIINFNTNKNSQILLRNNSNENNTYYNSNEVSNIDNNEITTKISRDKTMDEIDSPNIKASNIVTNKIKQKSDCKNFTKARNGQYLHLKNMKEIYENIIIFLPPNCYKILYIYESKIKNKILYQNLDQYYIIRNIQIIKEWANNNENLFKIINNSYNGNCEYALIKSYIYYFLFEYYIEKNRKEAIKINNKIISLFKDNFSYQLTFNDLAIMLCYY